MTPQKPRRFDRNLVVIGGGTAGLVSALVAAKAGASVTLAEHRAMGGDCLNTGCVPSKALIHAARLVAGARAAAAMGLLPPPGPPDSAAAMRHVHAAIAAIAPHDSAERYRGLGVDVRLGHARIASPWCVEIDGVPLTTRAIIVATGSEPNLPDIPGLDAPLTSETLWRLERAPGRLLIIGGGPIACELAQAFARLGSSVTVLQRGPGLLAPEDDDVAELLRARLEQEGVVVLTGAEALRADTDAEGRGMHVRDGSGTRRIGFDAVLAATGRTPRTAGIGLEALGIPLLSDGAIVTDLSLRTCHPSILACGDVTGPWQFTHAAAHQAWHASVNALFGAVWRIKPGGAVMPWVTYTDPEIGSAGLNEREAAARGIAVEVTRFPLTGLDRAIVDDARAGFVKVLTPPGRDRILGVTIAAPRAGEMLAEMVLAMRQGAGLKAVFGAIHAYPTYTEANKSAAGAWRTRHAPEWLLPWLGRYHAWMRG